MRINTALLSLFLTVAVGSSNAANLRSTQPTNGGQRTLTSIAVPTPFNAVYGTMKFVFKGACTVSGDKVNCKRGSSSAELTAESEVPTALRVCEIDGSGNSNCQSYKFRAGRNVDLVLNQAFPGKVWDMVTSAMENKFGRKNCRTQVGRTQIFFRCDGRQQGEMAFLESQPYSDDKEIPVPANLEVCLRDEDGLECSYSPFNDDTPAFVIIQYELN